MNSNSEVRFTVLTSGSTGTGNIKLSQPFTNFSEIVFLGADDGATYVVPTIFNTKMLAYCLDEFNKSVLLPCGGGHYYVIKPYSGGSSTTLFVLDKENAQVFAIYGITY